MQLNFPNSKVCLIGEWSINIYLKHLEAKIGEITQKGRNYTSDEQDSRGKLKGYPDTAIKQWRSQLR